MPGEDLQPADEHARREAAARQLALLAAGQFTPALTEAVRKEVAHRLATRTLMFPGEDVDATTAFVVTALPVPVSPAGRELIRGAVADHLAGRRGYSGARPQPPEEVADPIEHYRGELVHEATDLVVRGAGIDFAFVRTYRNQAVFAGPLGHNWDHAYHVTLRIDEIEARLWTGTLRDEVYQRHPRWGAAGFTYYVPADGVQAVLEPLGTPDAPAGWIRRSPDGLRHVLEPEPSASGRFRLTRIEDRSGNYLRFLYQDDLLIRVEVNHPARWVELRHDDARRVIRVFDHTGRTWRYDYDAHGDLVAVTTPATPGYPHGNTTLYTYSSAWRTGLLAHNLTAITDAAGRRYLDVRYGDDEARGDFNRVVWQREGRGDRRFAYEAVDPLLPDELGVADRPTFRCRVTEPNGFETVHVYNGWGGLLRKEECWHGPGGHEHVVWRYRYNRDGLVVASRSPEGRVRQVLHGRDHFVRTRGIEDEDELWRHDALTAEARLGFARPLVEVARGRPHGGGIAWSDRFGDMLAVAPEDVIVKRTYEPRYGQPLTVSDPRTTTRSDPQAIEPGAYHAHLTRFEYEGPPGDPTRWLRRTIRPASTAADGTPRPPVTEEIVARDARGRVLEARDEAGTVTRFEYVPESDDPRSGFLRATVIDPDGLAITVRREVDAAGREVEVVRPRGDGHASVVTTTFDALDRVVAQRGPGDVEVRTTYEPSGHIARTETAWTGPAGETHGVVVHTFEWDEAHRLTCETTGDADRQTHLATRHRYGPSGERVLTLSPAGRTVSYRYDQRLQLVAVTRAPGTADEATEHLEQDRDGLLVMRASAEGRRTRYEHDALGRLVAEIDPLGHVTRTSYDKGGRPTVVRRFERRPDGSYVLLARQETVYDERGRAIVTVENRFDEPLPATDLAHDYEHAPGPGRRVATALELDQAGRVVATIDPLGRRTEAAYDAAGRVVATVDPEGNRVETRYDAHGNVVRRDHRGVVRGDDGEPIREEVLTWTASHDERGRPVAEVDGLGNVTTYAHDSLDRVIRTTDPLGNVVEREYDVHGRLAAVIEHRTDTGTGTQLEPAIVRTEYDRDGGPVAQIDALGRRTELRYDRLGRPIERIFPDGSAIRTAYDRDGLPRWRREAHGVLLRFEHDDAGRLRRTDVDVSEVDPGVEIEGTRFIELDHDGAGRRITERSDAGERTIAYDSLGAALRETAAAASGPSRLLVRDVDDTGAVTAVTYPEGRRVGFRRDALGRLVEIVHEADGGGYPGAPGAPRSLARLAHAGARLRGIAHGNGTRVDRVHDAAGRLIEIAHRGPAGDLLRLQTLHDAASNPRLRLDAGIPGTAAERLGLDSRHQLTGRSPEPGRAPFDPGPLLPPAAPEATVPSRQALIDALLGATPAPLEEWRYDLAGNRIEELRDDAPPLSYQANALDQYVRVGDQERVHDRAGNLLSDGRFHYRYDAFHRLVRVTDAATGADVARHAYDASGRRVGETRGAVEVTVIYDGDHRIAEYHGDVLRAQVVHGDGVDAPIHLATGGADHWLHADALGSIRAVTDVAGAVVATRRYDPFGRILEATGFLDIPFGFVGRPQDPLTGLCDLRARTYDPATGRFLQRDPAGPVDGPNLYVYAGNNPLRFLDPTGLGRAEHRACETGHHTTRRKWAYEYDPQIFHGMPLEPGELGGLDPWRTTPRTSVEQYLDAGVLPDYPGEIGILKTIADVTPIFWSPTRMDRAFGTDTVLIGYEARYVRHATTRIDRVGWSRSYDPGRQGVAASPDFLPSIGLSVLASRFPVIGGRGFSGHGRGPAPPGPTRGLSGLPVRSIHEAFNQSFPFPPEIVAGFEIYGTKGIVGGTFQRNIWLVEATRRGTSPLHGLVRALEHEAIEAGAHQLNILGLGVVNPGLFSARLAARYGFSFRAINDRTIELSKRVGQ